MATAWEGYPALSISNAVADMFYRRANLEHAAASAANLTQGALLVSLLAIPILALSGPEWTFLGIIRRPS